MPPHRPLISLFVFEFLLNSLPEVEVEVEVEEELRPSVTLSEEDGGRRHVNLNFNLQESSNHNPSNLDPYIGMQFESEEAAKLFYDAYATHSAFIMRVDAFRNSMRDGLVVWRRLVCNKEGFRKLRPKTSENGKARAITREGCKAMIVVKKDKIGNWVVTRFIKEHNHPLLPVPADGLRTVLLPQIPDEKDLKIRELTAELQRERKRCAAYQQHLELVLRDMEQHSAHLSRNIDDIVQRMREIE